MVRTKFNISKSISYGCAGGRQKYRKESGKRKTLKIWLTTVSNYRRKKDQNQVSSRHRWRKSTKSTISLICGPPDQLLSIVHWNNSIPPHGWHSKRDRAREGEDDKEKPCCVSDAFQTLSVWIDDEEVEIHKDKISCPKSS